MSAKRNLAWLLIVILLLTFGASGCGKKSSPSQKPQSNTSGQKPKAPKSAETILKDINTLIGELDQKNKKARAPWMAPETPAADPGTQARQGMQETGGNAGQSNSSQGKDQNGGSEPDDSAGGGQMAGKSGGGSQNMSPAAQNEMQWQKISMSLMDIHRKWNELEPDATEAGLPASSLQAFEETLTRLTESVAGQKTDESLTAAIDLYDKYTVGISQVYTLSTPPELYQVEYRTMAAMAAAHQKDWTSAGDAISAAMEPWGLLKAQNKKADKKLLERCDFSLQDLKNAITSEDLNMVMIKGDIAQANLKQLEKSITGGGQSEGGQSSD